MPKFKVREGYAYYKPNEKAGYPAGAIVEIDDIAVGDQPWKLELIIEKEAEDGTEQARRLMDARSDEPIASISEKAAPKKGGRPPKVKV